MPPENITTTVEPQAFRIDDLALPLETEATTRHTVGSAVVRNSADSPATASIKSVQSVTTVISTPEATESTEQDKTVAIALVVTIFVVIVLITVIYVLFQKRRQICNRGKQSKAKADISANEVLITPVKNNGGVESCPQQPQPMFQSLPPSSTGGLVTGPRESRSRQAMPRKWFDSAAIKYMDQSTDTLDRV